MFREYLEKLRLQLSLDLNCAPEDFRAKENIVTVSAANEGRRRYCPDRPFLQMATLGGNTVITANECLTDFLRGFVRETEGRRLFEYKKMAELDAELSRYGFRIAPTHHMFLPCRDVRAEADCDVRWFLDSEIDRFYGDPRFPNAICYPEKCPERPDRIVAAAVDGETIMGMAGCSEDAPHWQQIGIDVLPAYRSRGLGSYLVTLVKNRILEMGDVPFYGAAAANIHSQNIALHSGFRPAWVETEAVPER